LFACLHGQGNLTALAIDFSPAVEETAPDTVTFDVSGLDRIFGLPQEIAATLARRAAAAELKVNIAMSMNPDAAICAARGFKGISVIPQGDEAKFLAPLPITVLAPTPEILEILERWGIHRLQQMASLPPLGIAERLGPEGLRLRELARGEAIRKLSPIQDPLSFEDEMELEYPLELLEPLAFVLARLINSIATRLATRGLATNELRLRLKLENRGAHERTLRLPVPTLDAKAFLKLWQLDLSSHPPCAPVVYVSLAMEPVKPRAAQSGLFIAAAPEPVKLELTLARIQSIVGKGRVGAPEIPDTHRPGAFRVLAGAAPLVNAKKSGVAEIRSPRLALRIFRPPREARVAVESGKPHFVAADGIRGKVLEAAGPWRTSGDWWSNDPWSRDEWDIALSDGALYRIYQDAKGWFVEACFD